MHDGPADGELIERARRGDDRAFRAIVERYEPLVAAVVVGFLGPGDEADDVGQEAFIRLYRSLDRFRGDASLATYLRKIAVNLSLNAIRRRRRFALRFRRSDDEDETLAGAGVEGVDDPEVAETRAAVRAAVAALGPKHAQVVVLRMMEGCSTRETAEALGIPEGTVLSRLARAMEKLQARLAPYVRDGSRIHGGEES
ncbi:RNA polymerase sigma factor [Longimicrobium sp.]|jgi:RNA polymerase sigma-70 factor (ECF subfamily)|uniref:RNA polymerase sigma factor n=1 Tax=Longimicrobium sp. TaxID=2029185 RepID=UPI002ED960B7